MAGEMPLNLNKGDWQLIGKGGFHFDIVNTSPTSPGSLDGGWEIYCGDSSTKQPKRKPKKAVFLNLGAGASVHMDFGQCVDEFIWVYSPSSDQTGYWTH